MARAGGWHRSARRPGVCPRDRITPCDGAPSRSVPPLPVSTPCSSDVHSACADGLFGRHRPKRSRKRSQLSIVRRVSRTLPAGSRKPRGDLRCVRPDWLHEFSPIRDEGLDRRRHAVHQDVDQEPRRNRRRSPCDPGATDLADSIVERDRPSPGAVLGAGLLAPKLALAKGTADPRPIAGGLQAQVASLLAGVL